VGDQSSTSVADEEEEGGDAQRPLAPARGWYSGSVVQDFVQRLRGLSFVDTVTIFGATFLFSVLPLFIIISTFAGRRIEWDLTHHLGLNNAAAHVVDDLFQQSPSHPVSAVVIGLVLAVAGTYCLASSIQRIYEQLFGVSRHKHDNMLRLLLWIVPFCLWFVYDSAITQVFKGVPGGKLLEGLAIFAGSTAFFLWSMHFLLAGGVGWRRLLRPALVTGAFWIGLGWFASVYFSSTIISDSRLYGTVGVIFSLLTWFIAIAAVIILGALTGVVWEDRRQRRSQPAGAAPA
jgi:membrane protein